MLKSSSTVSEKGLTTIPKKIRKKLNIQKGDKIYWLLSENEFSELIVVKDPIQFLKGRYSEKSITYEAVESKADKLISDMVKKNSTH